MNLSECRPLTHAQQRLDIDGLTRLHDEGAAELGAVLAQGVVEIRDAIAAKVPADGKLTPEQIVALKAPDAVMARMRGKVSKLLQQGHARGAQSAVDEVDAARERPIITRTPPEPAD